MNEQNIFLDESAELQESEDVGLDMTKEEIDIDVLETVDTVDVDVTEDVVFINESENNVDVDSAFPPLGDQEDIIWHSKLPDINNKDQHPIWAITGLEEKFAEIESIKQIHSNKENIAHYYRWADENPNAEDRSGCFVSFVENTNYIEISDTDVVGVTVKDNETAFLGNDIQDGRNAAYGLVCVSGIVPIRTLSDVQAGDKVVPDIDGRAKKSTNDYGYRVIEIREELTERYAVVALIPETVSLVGFEEDVIKLDEKLDSVQKNTIVAINAANEALKSRSTQIIQLGQRVEGTVELVNNANQMASSAQDAATNAKLIAATSKAVAESAQTTVKEIKNQVTLNIDNMSKDILNLTKDVEPLTTWTYKGNTGAEYLIEHIQNDLSTKTEVSTFESVIGDAFTAMSRNAKGNQNIVHEVNYYFVGGHSPSYGLSLAEARDMLQENIIYVPVENVIESALDSQARFNFYRGNSYKWEKVSEELTWKEYVDNVGFSDSYIIGNEQIEYWYTSVDVTHDDINYPKGSLSHWVDGAWVIVANIENANAAWVTSRVYQTANSVGNEIADANGNIAALEMKVSGEGSTMRSLVTYGDVFSIMESVANDEGVKTQDVSVYEGKSLLQVLQLNESPTGLEFYTIMPEWDKNTNTWAFDNTYIDKPIDECFAKVPEHPDQFYKYNVFKNIWTRRTYGHTDGFVAGIFKTANEEGSGISLLADHIDLTGKTIDLTTDSITINSTNFKVTSGGSIEATDGTIGGWKISTNSLYNGTNDASTAPTIYIGNGNLSKAVSIADSGDKTDWRLKIGNNFGVDSTGTLYANGGTFMGTIKAATYLDSEGNNMMTNNKWTSDYLDVRGLNVNDGNLIIDEDGNLTSKNGTIAGAKFYNSNEDTWIEIGNTRPSYGLILKSKNYTDGIFGVYNGDFGYTTFKAKLGYGFLETEAESKTSFPQGTWDFSSATVTGIKACFA